MIPIQDLLHRIRWDAEFGNAQFVIGYLDRLSGDLVRVPPKGVMLSHANVLANAEAVLAQVPAFREDVFLSFLPLSHAFERTVGFYAPMMAGSCVAYARSVQLLAEDLLAVRPTVLASVPRICERAYSRIAQRLAGRAVSRVLFERAVEVGWRRFDAAQGRAPKLGRRAAAAWWCLRRLVARRVVDRFGGRLPVAVSGGAPLAPRIARCFVGLGVPMLQGYGPTEAAPVVTGNRPDDNVPESVGTALPGIELKLGANAELLVRGPNVMLGYWRDPQATREALANPLVLDAVLQRIGTQLARFPAHAAVRRVWLTLEPWTIEDGLITPTLKIKRQPLERRFAREIAELYSGAAPAAR